MKNKYTVIVGNLGTVYVGSNLVGAKEAFREYKNQSKNKYGRVAGESVVMMKNGELKKEFIGNLATKGQE